MQTRPTIVLMLAAGLIARSDTPERRLTRSIPIASSHSVSAVLGSSAPAELEPEQRILVTVDGRATLDSRTGLYTYAYELTSDSSSRNDVAFFALAPITPPDSTLTPPHWTTELYPYRGSSSAMTWWVTDIGELPAGYVDTGNLPPSQFDLEPGQRVSGFGFLSPLPPRAGAIRFFAQGFDTIPSGPDPGDEDPQPGVFEIGVTGTTLGPDSSKIGPRKKHW